MSTPRLEYDKSDRIIQINFSDNKIVNCFYDAHENIAAINDSEFGKSMYEYDELKRLSKVTFPSGRSLNYEYDAVGNRIRMADGDGMTIHYSYNKNNLLTSIKFNSNETIFKYDPLSRLIEKKLPNGVEITYSYSATGKLNKMVVKNQDSVLFDFSFKQDKVGNYLSIECKNSRDIKTTELNYDSLYRVAEASYSDGTIIKYEYDSLGNRTKENSKQSSSAYTYNKEQQLTEAGNIHFRFDERGNLIEKIKDNQSTHFEFSDENKLRKVALPDGQITQYQYDILGRRVKKIFNDDRNISFIYDGFNLIEELENNKTVSKYIYDIGTDYLISMIRNEKTFYYIHDHIGSVIALTDEEGKIITEYDYDVWGNVKNENATKNPFLFTGREWDNESHLYYFRTRYYDASVGRFTSKDPLPFTFNFSQLNNKYSYCLNNPQTYVDPLGLFPTEKDGSPTYPFIPPVESPNKIVPPFDTTPSPNPLKPEYFPPSQPKIPLPSIPYPDFIPPLRPSTPPFQGSGNSLPQSKGLTNPGSLNPFKPFNYEDPFGASSPMQYGAGLLKDLGSEAFKLTSNNFRSKNPLLNPFFEHLSPVLNAISVLAPFTNPNKLAGHIGQVEALSAWLGAILGDRIGLGIGFSMGLAAALAIAPIGAISLPIIATGAILGRVIGSTAGAYLFGHIGKFLGNTALTGGKNISDNFHNFSNEIKESVGGVLFDKSAELLTDIEEIHGAYWDEILGQLVLVGKRNGTTENFFLPKMDIDHLAVAIRAVFSNSNIGVSIDQPEEFKNSKKFPPHNTMMPVRYLGRTEDTLFGAIMLEADRLLKNLSLGKDNETDQPINATVHDFKNELQLSALINGNRNQSWTRMWFEIDSIKLQLGIKETDDRTSIAFSEAKLLVKAKPINENQKNDPVAEKFAEHFTKHFKEFEKEFPILHNLTQLAKTVAIAKWLKQSNKPVNLGLLNEYQIIKVPTPTEIRGIRAELVLPNATGTLTLMNFGGVNFDFKFESIKDNGEAQLLKDIAQKSKFGESIREWNFINQEQDLKAIVLQLKKVEGSFQHYETDYENPSSTDLSFTISRLYDSSNRKGSCFGNGWKLVLPFDLKIAKNKNEISSLLLINHKGDANKYYFIKDKNCFALVTEESQTVAQTEQGETVQTSFKYNPENIIRKNSAGSFTYSISDTLNYKFDSVGKLIEIFSAKKNFFGGTTKDKKLEMTYDKSNLVKMGGIANINFNLIYDNNNRITKIDCPNQAHITYEYDRFGNLSFVKHNSKTIHTYVYDINNSLIKTIDRDDKVVFRNNYDLLKRKIIKQNDKVLNNIGGVISREYDGHFRLLNETDESGNQVTYLYDSENNLTQSLLSYKNGGKIIYEYDKFERINKIIDPLKNISKFDYDLKGNLTTFTDANNNCISMEHDEMNNLITLRDAEGNEWKQTVNAQSQTLSVTDPLGNQTKFTYDKIGLLTQIENKNGNVKYYYKGETLSKIIDANGNNIQFLESL